VAGGLGGAGAEVGSGSTVSDEIEILCEGMLERRGGCKLMNRHHCQTDYED